MANLVSYTNVTELPDTPHQPQHVSFPKRSFGKKNIVMRSFQALWFKSWPFLHYDEARDLAFCHICVKGFKEKKMRSSTRADPAFVSCAINILLPNF